MLEYIDIFLKNTYFHQGIEISIFTYFDTQIATYISNDKEPSAYWIQTGKYKDTTILDLESASKEDVLVGFALDERFIDDIGSPSLKEIRKYKKKLYNNQLWMLGLNGQLFLVTDEKILRSYKDELEREKPEQPKAKSEQSSEEPKKQSKKVLRFEKYIPKK